MASEAARLIERKLTINEGRTWPDWRTAEADKAIEHDRTKCSETHPSTNRMCIEDAGHASVHCYESTDGRVIW